MDIHRSSIKDFILPKVKSVFVIDYYEGIRGTLASREDFPYKDFFANPRVRTKTEIIWSTDLFSDKPVLLKDLRDALKEKYCFALKERINTIEELVETLKSEGNMPFADMLSKTISYIDEDSVYCSNGNIVVVNWGLIPRNQGIGNGSIYRSGKFVGIWAATQNRMVKSNEASPNLGKDSFSEHEDVLDNIYLHPQSVNEISEKGTGYVEEKINQDVDTIHPNDERENTSLQIDEISIPTTDTLNKGLSIKEEAPKVTQSKIKENNKDKEERLNSQKTDKDEAQHKPNNDNSHYTWYTLWSNLWIGFKFLLRKLWWIFLIILLLLFILFLGRNYQGPLSLVNPFYNPLPETPVVLPIEKENVGMSSDGNTQIATDRLNILLEKTGNDTMLEWAKAFKREYCTSDYEIFYYNEDLYNLQIKVPAEKREQIKNELNDKLKGFTFEVYDETVYQTENVSFNDPELRNPSHSWYLGVIGAYDAWNITQGDPDIVVAVVDNGFDVTHPEFKGKIVHPYNVLTQNSSIRPIMTKEGENAHGTHVAATAVGNCNNGTGLLGIAPKCKFMPVQVGNDNPNGSMSNMAIMEGVLYAINQGADVINVSLGMYTPQEVKMMSEGQQLNYISSTMKQEELLWNKIFEKAKQRNSIIVFAAGNDNVVAGIDPKKRSNSTIRVSAVNTILNKADFSNYGRYANLNREYSSLSAPGVAIFSAAPRGQYVNLQGTSMAAPIVTGIVALLKSIDKNITEDQAVKLLKETGREINPNIGPLINMSQAIKQMVIDSLSQLCPDANNPQDTLKYKDAVRNSHGLDGLWKTTTALVATTDNSPIELYMQFYNLIGTLTIKNQGNVFTAPLTANVKNGKITITQHKNATSSTSNTYFLKYLYVCSSDHKGNLTCKASNSKGTVVFNLIRIK